jgi:hypothetical protein
MTDPHALARDYVKNWPRPRPQSPLAAYWSEIWDAYAAAIDAGVADPVVWLHDRD